MTIAAGLDRERSLEAMWHAYRAHRFVAPTLVAIDAGVVHGLLNARYYDSARGQFLTEEPIFLNIGDPAQVQQLSQQDQQRYLADPQQLNAYSYGRDNPINRKDTSGKNALLLGFAIGGDIYGIAKQLEYDLGRGQPSSVPTYIRAGLTGAVQGLAVGGSIELLSPSGFVRAYGLFDSGVKAYDFSNQVVINSNKYSTDQKLDSLTALYIDLARRAASIAVPKPYKEIYESLNTIYDSIDKLYNQTHMQAGQGVPNSSSFVCIIAHEFLITESVEGRDMPGLHHFR